MARRWIGNALLATALATGLPFVTPPHAAHAEADSAEGICATTSDPASCELMLDNTVRQGSASETSGAAGAGGVQELLQGFTQGQSPSTIPGTIAGPQPSVVVTPTQPSSRHRGERSHLEDTPLCSKHT